MLNSWFEMIGTPEEIISDNARESFQRNLKNFVGKGR